MKNIQCIADKAEIHTFVMRLWKTDMFRESHRAGGFIFRAVERFAWLPRVFAEMSNDHLERAHFSSWWGVTMLREDYTNPVIHDLYLLHEFYHAAHMPYIPNIGKAAFDDKMQRNELEASVLSEIAVYFEMPGLREVSFDHDIYADRFLNDPVMNVLWKTNKDVAVETIRSMRRDVMVSKPEHLMDLTESWIRRFAEQNAIYSITWSDRYLEVERRMADLQTQAAADRNDALKYHVDWIIREAERDPLDNVPFRQEAELFATFYWANKEKYSVAMAKNK
jgi:hypothetical protein